MKKKNPKQNKTKSKRNVDLKLEELVQKIKKERKTAKLCRRLSPSI